MQNKQTLEITLQLIYDFSLFDESQRIANQEPS